MTEKNYGLSMVQRIVNQRMEATCIWMVSKYGWLRFCVQDRYEYKKDNKWAAVRQGL